MYLNFVDAYQNGYSGRVKKCIQSFVIIFQVTKFCTYINETIHIITCFQQLWKLEFKLVCIILFCYNFANEIQASLARLLSHKLDQPKRQILCQQSM